MDGGRGMAAPRIEDQRVADEMLQYDNDLVWILQHYDSLAEEYGNKFIAVLGQKVVSSADKVEMLVADLKTRFPHRWPHIVIEFIYKEHPNFVLI